MRRCGQRLQRQDSGRRLSTACSKPGWGSFLWNHARRGVDVKGAREIRRANIVYVHDQACFENRKAEKGIVRGSLPLYTCPRFSPGFGNRRQGLPEASKNHQGACSLLQNGPHRACSWVVATDDLEVFDFLLYFIDNLCSFCRARGKSEIFHRKTGSKQEQNRCS